MIGTGVEGKANNQFRCQCGLAVLMASRAGEASLLFVADCSNHRVQVFNIETSEYVRTIGTGEEGAANTQFNCPKDVAVIVPRRYGDAVLLAVADSGNHRVQVLDAMSGRHVRTFGTGTQGAAIGQLNLPSGLAIQSSDDLGTDQHMFVADYRNHRVQVFSLTTGRHVRTIGSKGSAAGQLKGPMGLALQQSPSAGAVLYVVDSYNHRVQSFDASDGRPIQVFGSGEGSGIGQMSCPHYIALHCVSGEDCLIFVTDYLNHRVLAFNARTGSVVRTLGPRGSAVCQLSGPTGVCVVAGVGGALLVVSDYGNNRVQIFAL